MAIMRRNPGLRVIIGGALLVLALWALLPSPMVDDAQAAERTLTAQIRALVRSNAQMSRRVDRLETTNSQLNSWVADLETQLTALKSSQPDLSPRVADLEYTLGHFSRSGNEVTISGANLHIESGSGRTDGAVNSLGNLIIGYNERRNSGNDRTGSHMLVVGSWLNYSSFGGIVAGTANSTSGKYSSVTGGIWNTACGENSSVSGGRNGKASGENSSVSGGDKTHANGISASITGGYGNTASGTCSSVSGGIFNTAGGDYSSVSGGRAHVIPYWGINNWVAGLLFQAF